MVYIRMMSVKHMKNTVDTILMCLLPQYVSFVSALSKIPFAIFIRAMIYYISATFSRLLLIVIVDVRRFKLCAFS